MSKYRIKYERSDDAKFISHLDLMRTMNRALRRAEAPLQYTQGFNPHSIMTVALPLSVGITSECEYLDITFTEDIDVSAFTAKLNATMPAGLRAIEIRKADEMRAFKYIETALYTVSFESDIAPDCDAFMNMGKVVMTKRTKSGEKDEDILPDIHSVTCVQNGETYKMDMRINVGSKRNLKPELVLAAFEKFQNVKADNIKIHRKAIYFDDGAEVF
ncbi:MAG: DUF2344 domain-containing protein [Clostridia bacterium]|nr:DUF2344 domain-containing protein [Clostridia bacterium]